MAENLKYKGSEGCFAYNQNGMNVFEYGYLYKWSAAMEASKINGWHLPSKEEWEALSQILVEQQRKEATDENSKSAVDGFNCKFGGSFNNQVAFSDLGEKAVFWSNTCSGASRGVDFYYEFECSIYNKKLEKNGAGANEGKSVRLVKDMNYWE
jgi:uncharacterized protein (TIGR02145 family)